MIADYLQTELMNKKTSEQGSLSIISKFSEIFVNRWRASVLLLIATLLLGYMSYTTLLKREGFPEVQFPAAIIATPYFVDDINQVDTDITVPIEIALTGIEEIETISSSTNENFSSVVTFFKEDVEVKDGLEVVEKALEEAQLPNDISPTIQTIDAATIDGEHNVVISLISNENLDLAEMQIKADEVSAELTKVSEVKSSKTIEQIKTRTNPITGEEFESTELFNRTGYLLDDEFVFANSVDVGVISNSSVGTLELSDAIKKKIDELEDDGVLDGYTVSYGGDYSADTLRDQISTLESNALTGLIAVVVIVLLLIGWRASAVTLLFIPTVMASTMFALYVTGNTLNTLTLFGLILVLGLIVDDAIVVVEAIDRQKKLGDKGLLAIKKAISRIGVADILGTVTTVLVFMPLLFVSGLLGEFIFLLPYTVILALSLSLIIGLSLIPFASHFAIKDKSNKKQSEFMRSVHNVIYLFSNITNFLGEKWGEVVKLYLNKWYLTLAVIILSVVAVAVGGNFASQLKFSIFGPPKDADYMLWTASFEDETTLKEAKKLTLMMEEIITEHAGEDLISADIYNASEKGFQGFIKLTPFNNREITVPELSEIINEDLVKLQGTSAKVEISGAGPPVSEYPFQVKIFDNSIATLKLTSNEIAEFLDGRAIDGIEDEFITEVDIEGLDTLSKEDSNRYVQVRAKVTDPENTQAVLNIQEMINEEFDTERLEELGVAEDGLSYDGGQESENIASFESTIVVFFLSLILMYVLLVALYNSFSQPLIIFLAIVFSFPGLFPGLFFADISFGFFSMIGIIALGGIVVNNTIMLVDYANTEQKLGKSIKDAISDAMKARFRPLVATSITTVIALIPLAVSDPFWEPLAYSIIFGLLSSTVLVILAFPAYYGALEGMRLKRNIFFGKVKKKLS